MYYMYFLTWLILIFCLSLFLSDLGEELNCLAFDGNTIIVGGGSGILSVWDIFHVKNIGKIPAHQGPITCLWVSENGDYVATGGDDRRVVVWTTTKSWRKNINFRFRNLIFFVKLHKIMKKRKILREIEMLIYYQSWIFFSTVNRVLRVEKNMFVQLQNIPNFNQWHD